MFVFKVLVIASGMPSLMEKLWDAMDDGSFAVDGRIHCWKVEMSCTVSGGHAL